MTLLGGAQLRSGTSGQGNAGDISITADGAVTVDGVELRERTLSASGIGSTVSAPDAITGQPARGKVMAQLRSMQKPFRSPMVRLFHLPLTGWATLEMLSLKLQVLPF